MTHVAGWVVLAVVLVALWLVFLMVRWAFRKVVNR
jgi:hypothetical protein